MAWSTNLPPAQHLSRHTRGEDWNRVVQEVLHSDVVALDTETTGLVKWKDYPLYFSLAWGNQRATIHADYLPFFDSCFRNPDITWVLANAKFDMHMLANTPCSNPLAPPTPVIVEGKWHDIQVMDALLHDEDRHDLKHMAKMILHMSYGSFEDQFGKIGPKMSPKELIEKAERTNMQLLVEYAANDAWATLKLYHALKYELERTPTFSLFASAPPYIVTLWDYFAKVESPYTKVLWHMERRGVKVDRQRLLAAAPEAKGEIENIKRECNAWLCKEGYEGIFGPGESFNPGSSQHIRVLAQRMGVKPIRWTDAKDGNGNANPSWDAKVLDFYKHDYPIFDLVLKFREFDKLLGTYIIKLERILDHNDRIHSNFSQHNVRTGRLASSEPNLQNCPKPENDAWKLRSMFITDPGWSILCADYSQLEMRLLAAAAQDQKMVDVFLRGWDIHAGNGAMMYDHLYDDIYKSKKVLGKAKEKKLSESDTIYLAKETLPGIVERAAAAKLPILSYLNLCDGFRLDAKAIGFGLNYGMGARTLSKHLGCSMAEAQKKIDLYKGTYPAVENFMREAVEETRATGYAFTVLGRRRSLPGINSRDHAVRSMAERLATNTQIQGSAADVTKMAQMNIHYMNLQRDYDCHNVLQVHDELVYEVPDENADACLPYIEELMAHPFGSDLFCPLEADCHKGKNWMEAKG